MPPVRASRAGFPAPGSQRRALVRFLTASQEPDQRLLIGVMASLTCGDACGVSCRLAAGGFNPP
jgi:hypothetical protein